jgi:serine/threonine-protein kinase
MDPAVEWLGLPLNALGRYELLGILGRGGMANVYLGRHSGEGGFQRFYAIKVLHSHLAEEEAFVTMLFEEARIAARLHHPNVVPIVDLGFQDGVHYVVMEYVEGCALSTLLQGSRDSRSARLIIPILLDVLNGLHAAHTLADDDGTPMHLVHRDVSPQNILVGTDGTARITDFGIAKAESRITSTRPGDIKGKASFMSPEQILDASRVDCRADVYSVGVVLWMSLTGQRLFQGPTSVASFSNVLNMTVDPPSTVGFRPPAVLDRICMRALERDRDRRPSTAMEMEEALRTIAGANGLLGSKHEVADWVQSIVGPELTKRHAEVRAIINSRPCEPTSSTWSRATPRSTRLQTHTPVSPSQRAVEDNPSVEIASLEIPVQLQGYESVLDGASPAKSLSTNVGDVQFRPHVPVALIASATALVVIGIVAAIRALSPAHTAPIDAVPMGPVAPSSPKLPLAPASPAHDITVPPAAGPTDTGEAPALAKLPSSIPRSALSPFPGAAPRANAEAAQATPGPIQASTRSPARPPKPTFGSRPPAADNPTSTPPPPDIKKKAPLWDNDSPVPPQ